MDTDITLVEQSLERIPPQSIEAEQAVLGSLLINPESIIKVVGQLDAEAFYRKSHQTIFATMNDLFDRNEPIDDG